MRVLCWIVSSCCLLFLISSSFILLVSVFPKQTLTFIWNTSCNFIWNYYWIPSNGLKYLFKLIAFIHSVYTSCENNVGIRIVVTIITLLSIFFSVYVCCITTNKCCTLIWKKRLKTKHTNKRKIQ